MTSPPSQVNFVYFSILTYCYYINYINFLAEKTQEFDGRNFRLLVFSTMFLESKVYVPSESNQD